MDIGGFDKVVGKMWAHVSRVLRHHASLFRFLPDLGLKGHSWCDLVLSFVHPMLLAAAMWCHAVWSADPAGMYLATRKRQQRRTLGGVVPPCTKFLWIVEEEIEEAVA